MPKVAEFQRNLSEVRESQDKWWHRNLNESRALHDSYMRLIREETDQVDKLLRRVLEAVLDVVEVVKLKANQPEGISREKLLVEIGYLEEQAGKVMDERVKMARDVGANVGEPA